ncbi:creatininase family protein [bacterium]|nr:MAG: creatininase family protein [bacterium]
MRIEAMNWMQAEAALRRDDRCVLPLGCTEQHAYLSLATDTILAGRIAVEAAEPLGIPVFPALPYGLTPSFVSYPGTVTLSLDTFGRVVKDVLSSLYRQGFRRILIVNGHGGNAPGRASATEWLLEHTEAKVKWHDWWNAPLTWEKVQATDPKASHASWMENFPWTRLPGVDSPDGEKPMAAMADFRHIDPVKVRRALGDGSFGGRYQRSDEEMLAIWRVAVEETRALLESGW